MRITYVSVQGDVFAETLGPQLRADAEQDWDWLMSEMMSDGYTLTRMHLEREGDILRRAEFDGSEGPVVISLIDDGSR